jgi:antitoxin VapB
MPLNIKNPEADRVARELTELTGESITDAVIVAMKERLEREKARGAYATRRAEIRRVRERYLALPLLDDRPADEVIGYDEEGLPG